MRWLLIIGAPLIASCTADDGVDPITGKASSEQGLVLTANTPIKTQGILEYNVVVFAENPQTLLQIGDFHGYEFDGKAGGVVTINMNAAVCSSTDTLLDLFGPENAAGSRGASLAESDDAYVGACATDSQIRSYRLPVSGRYLIVATTFAQYSSGHYKLNITCDNNACTLPGLTTFASTRILQTDINRGAIPAANLFDIGDFMFEEVFAVQNGMGNALPGLPANNTPRPNFRQFPHNVHFAGFGAPEAQTCVTCHNVGGDDGAGDLNHNIFQIGDGFNRASGVPRNPPTVLGNGLRQRIGEEMTADLQAELTAAKLSVSSSHAAVTKALTSKGISFGSLVVNADGTVNTAGVVGVDPDLIVKPFGWKGREATLRRFVEGGFRVHFGMQTQPSIDKNCLNRNDNNFGNGANCQDPDGDGVTNEINEGQLTAMAIYMGLRETPVRIPAATAAAQARINAGETLFSQVGCAGCHTPRMTINNPNHFEASDSVPGAGITLHLATDTKTPHPALNANGTMTVESFSDFKRHNVGNSLADSKPFGIIGANQFITPPLWGLRDSAPYLHDGRSPTILDAILKHGDATGDDAASVNLFRGLTADNQAKVVEFLSSLGRAEDL